MHRRILTPCRCLRCRALDTPRIRKLKREIELTQAARDGTPRSLPEFGTLCKILKKRKRELTLETFRARLEVDPANRCWPIDDGGNAPVHLLL